MTRNEWITCYRTLRAAARDKAHLLTHEERAARFSTYDGVFVSVAHIPEGVSVYTSRNGSGCGARSIVSVVLDNIGKCRRENFPNVIVDKEAYKKLMLMVRDFNSRLEKLPG